MTMRELQRAYVRCDRKYRTREKNLRGQIEELQRQLDALTMPHWIDRLVAPIAKALEGRFPEYESDILGPFGICCHTSIHLYRKGVADDKRFEGDNCLSLTFEPGDLEVGELRLKDHTQDTHRYPPGSIGEVNGMNYPTVPVPPEADVEWFAAHFERQEPATAK